MLNTLHYIPKYQGSDPLSNAFTKKLIITKDTNLNDLLQDPSIIQIYKTNCQILNNFLIHHVDELFILAFKDDNSVAAISAFKILSIPNYYLISALASKPQFSNYVSNLFKQNKVSDRLASRVCVITQTIFSFGDINACKICTYITNLLDYCYNSSVYSFFSSIFYPFDETERIQNWLIENGIIESIEHKIKSITVLSKIEDFSKESETLINLFRILSISFKNLSNSIEKSTLCTLFDKIPVNLPKIIYNFLWETLNALFSKNNALKLCKFSNEARDNLIAPTNHIYRFHSESVSFLAKYVTIRSDLIDNELIKSVLGLFLQFSHCSFFQIEAERFFIEACKVDILLCRIVKYVAPVLIIESSISGHNLVPYFSLSILENLVKIPAAKEIMLNLENGKEFLEKTLPEYIKKRDSGYGGSSSNSIWSLIFSPLSIF